MRRPTPRQFKLARRARGKPAGQRTPAEKQAIKAVRAFNEAKRAQPAAKPAGYQGGGGASGKFEEIIQRMLGMDIDAEAQRLAQADIAPLLSQANYDRGVNQWRGVSGMGAAGAVTQSAMPYAQQIGQNIRDVYRGASQDQAAFAKGYSQGLELVNQQSGQQAAGYAALQGAPGAQQQQIMGQATGAGPSLYATGGEFPASAMGREGAAFGAWGAALPGIIGILGQQNAAQIASGFNASAQDAARRAGDLRSQLPDLISGYRNELQDRQLSVLQAYQDFKAQKQDMRLRLQAAKLAAQAAGLDTRAFEEEQRRYDQEWERDEQRYQDALAAEQAGGGGGGGGDGKERSGARNQRREKGRDELKQAAKKVAKEAWDIYVGTGVNVKQKALTPAGLRQMKKEIKRVLKPLISQLRKLGVRQEVINKIIADAIREQASAAVARTSGLPEIKPTGTPGTTPVASVAEGSEQLETEKQLGGS